ncbi:MAG: hypothetical protein AAB417_01310 [Patescibacteria group bacterium]
MGFISTIYSAAHATLSSGRLALAFAILWALLFAGMFSIPVVAIPGNNIGFQAELFRFGDYGLLAVLGFFGALTLTIQINIFLQKFETVRQTMGSAALSGAGLLSGVFSSLFASATCGMCLVALFGFLGFSAVLTIITYRWYIVAASFLLLFISLYFASSRLNEGCKACAVKN